MTIAMGLDCIFLNLKASVGAITNSVKGSWVFFINQPNKMLMVSSFTKRTWLLWITDQFCLNGTPYKSVVRFSTDELDQATTTKELNKLSIGYWNQEIKLCYRFILQLNKTSFKRRKIYSEWLLLASTELGSKEVKDVYRSPDKNLTYNLFVWRLHHKKTRKKEETS